MKSRHVALGLVASASAAAALWVPPKQSAVVLPVVRPFASVPITSRDRPARPEVGLASLAPRLPSAEQPWNLFGAPAWARPKPVLTKSAAIAPAAEAPLQAPPAPFRVIGRYEEGGQVGVFVEHQQKALVARVGDQLTPEWKVEAIESTRLVLQYLPLAQKQTVEWSAP
jgi:hypothetical protein